MNLRLQCLNFKSSGTAEVTSHSFEQGSGTCTAPRDLQSCWLQASTSLMKCTEGGIVCAQNNSPPVTMDVSLRVTMKLFNLGCSSLTNKTCFVRHFNVRRHAWTSKVSYKTCHCNTFLRLQKEYTNLCVQALDSYDTLAAWHETEHVCLSDKTTIPSQWHLCLIAVWSFASLLLPSIFNDPAYSSFTVLVACTTS